MNKEDYYTTRTDRQRISELQRKVMRLETEIKELLEEIDYYHIKSDRDDKMIEQSYQTLDTKTLNKNLEITEVSKQLDDLTSENVKLKEQLKYMDIAQVRLTKDFLSQIKEQSREQTPMHMLQTLETCYTHIEQNVIDPELLKDLRNVIKFLQK